MKQFTGPLFVAVCVLFAALNLSLPPAKAGSLARSRAILAGQTYSITVGCASGPTLPITPGSFALINTSDGLNNVAIDIGGTWGGGAMTVYFAAQPYPTSGFPAPTLHQVPNTSLAQFTNAPSTGITSGLQDVVTTTVSGAGTLYVLAPAGLTGSATVTLRCGAGGPQSNSTSGPISGTVTSNAGTGWAASGLATASAQTTGNTSLSTIATNTTGVSTAANQSTTNTLLAAGLPAALASGRLATNGFTTFSAVSSSEASNTVTNSGASLTLSGGGDPPNACAVIVTNTGTVDGWASPYLNGHTWPVPAGSGIYVPWTGVLYGLSSGANTTFVCTKGAL